MSKRLKKASFSFLLVPVSSIFQLVWKDCTKKVKCFQFMAQKKETKDTKSSRPSKRPRKVYFYAPMSWQEVIEINLVCSVQILDKWNHEKYQQFKKY